MTLEELEQKIVALEQVCANLEYKYLKLREWSDDNDLWLREMIDTLTDTVDSIMDDHCCCEKYKTTHELNKANKKREEE